MFKTCMTFLILWNTKEDILKNVGNQKFQYALISIELEVNRNWNWLSAFLKIH